MTSSSAHHLSLCYPLQLLVSCVVAEWYFRSGLDRYVWIWGMICAYRPHPYCTKFLNGVEEMPQVKRIMVRSSLLALTGAACVLYCVHIYSLPKLEYNKVRL